MVIYPGVKAATGVYHAIINLMPPHDRYIEPFLGGGAIMRLKRPAALNIGIDLDPASSGLAWVDRESSQSFMAMVGNAFDWLRRARLTDRDLVYLDPPYVLSTRTKKKQYKHELRDVDHRRLLRWAIATPARVMISGYRSALYNSFLGGNSPWKHIEINDQTRGGRRRSMLWFNFPIPNELHDYRFLGVNYREREKIRKQQRRWSAKLGKMSRLQRLALMAAIADHAVSVDGDVR